MHELELIILVPWISLCETAVLLHIPRVFLVVCCPSPGFILLSDLPASPFHALYCRHILALLYVLPCPCSILGSPL